LVLSVTRQSVRLFIQQHLSKFANFAQNVQFEMHASGMS